MDPAKVNPNGGAVALGHPIGATGAILTVKCLYELQRTGKKYGLITMWMIGLIGIVLPVGGTFFFVFGFNGESRRT